MNIKHGLKKFKEQLNMKKNVLKNCNKKRANVMKCLKITVIYFLMSFPLFAQNDVYKDWMIGPFEKLQPSYNPVMGANFDTKFFCPMLGKQVRWEARAIIGGGVVVKDNKIYMVYHAEDAENGYKYRSGSSPGIMRMGLAWSYDGVRFERRPEPVLYPEHDEFKSFEWSGGCEIPRLTEAPDGSYVLYYDGWNRKTAHLMVATSKDLIHWKKHGSAFANSGNAKYSPSFWSKSAAVVTEMKDGRLVAVKINGKYWMYFNDTGCNMATSDNLIDWTVIENPDGTPYTFLPKRPDKFDKDIREGGVAVRTEKGIVIIYNTFNIIRKAGTPENDRCEISGLGQALADANDPMKLLDRSEIPFLVPDREYEKEGAVNNVVFCTGIVYFKNRWYLYHNGGDRVLCVAISDNEKILR
jgi:predicted GH43/DUF377 family glycosyl hydrolase